MAEKPTFRQQAFEILVKHLGEPQRLQTESGFIYRWVLKRDQGHPLHVTMDSPELPDLAHVMISDPSPGHFEPLITRLMRTLEEVEVFAKRVVAQWKGDPK